MELGEKILKAQKGDDNAFYEIMDEKKSMLYKVAYTYTKNREDALDIVSDTFYKAYISIKKLKEPEFFNTWLVRILINCAVDHIRKNKKVVASDSIQLEKEHNAWNREEIIDLKAAVDRLDEKYKTIVILKYFQDMKLSEIAEVLSCPLGTVKTNLHKALSELKLDLKEDVL